MTRGGGESRPGQAAGAFILTGAPPRVTPPAMTSLADIRAEHEARTGRQRAALARALRLALVAVLVALGLRSCVYEPFNIPSESMLPRLMVGDYLFVAKWPYGYSRYSLPLGLPLFEGRIGGALPERGDVIVFKTPRDNRTDYIKRVIALPGDTVAMQGGQVILNGQPLPQARIQAFALPPGTKGCDTPPVPRGGCPYPAFAETLPGGQRYAIIDQVSGDIRDDMAPVTVPDGHVFVLGDNRDDSADSRFHISEGGVGLVPVANIIGRADRIFFSLDPGNRSLRPERFGQGLAA
jgi:signal peptidase I